MKGHGKQEVYNIIKWLIAVYKLTREIRKKAFDAILKLKSRNKTAAKTVNEYLKKDYEDLKQVYGTYLSGQQLSQLARHIHFGQIGDYEYIINSDLDVIEGQVENYSRERINQHQNENKDPYVSIERLMALRQIDNENFDMAKLINLCEELNVANEHNNFMTIAMIVRSIIDHIPPIFRQDSFAAVANNYSGSRSFKRAMHHLEGSLRSVADTHLHSQIKRKESLPTFIQVDFRSSLDVLLSEICLILASVGNSIKKKTNK